MENTTTPAIPNPLAPLEHETIFRAMVDSVRDYAIFLLDPNGFVVTWNPGAERIKQYRPEEIIGKHFSIFYPEAEKRADKPGFELKVAKATGRFEDEGWRIRKDGSRFWANVVITRILGHQGQLIGFGKITRDLTERRASEQRFRLLVEGVTDYAIFLLDRTGHVASWNSGAQRIKQYTVDEIMGKHFSNFYTPEDREKGMPQHVLKQAEEHEHWQGEGWRVRKDGSRFWSSVVVTALRDEEGQLTGFSKVTRDITDRKQLLDELQRHTEELERQVEERERTNAELEAFSYSVSHDLRAPLRAIEGFASALKEDYGNQLDETAHDYLHEIISASTRMNCLVRDLLEYGKLSRIEIIQQSVAVGPLVRRILGEGPPEYRTATLTGNLDCSVLAHEPTLAQVLHNLISNAFKFHPKDVVARVEVNVQDTGRKCVRIAVKDRGIGILPEHQEKIFKVFERLHGLDEFPGTGIGLAIVKRGIERMGGRVGVESQPDQGSTFWIELPSSKERGI
jgi:PAS domain S-box-containing protein